MTRILETYEQIKKLVDSRAVNIDGEAHVDVLGLMIDLQKINPTVLAQAAAPRHLQQDSYMEYGNLPMTQQGLNLARIAPLTPERAVEILKDVGPVDAATKNTPEWIGQRREFMDALAHYGGDTDVTADTAHCKWCGAATERFIYSFPTRADGFQPEHDPDGTFCATCYAHWRTGKTLAWWLALKTGKPLTPADGPPPLQQFPLPPDFGGADRNFRRPPLDHVDERGASGTVGPDGDD